MSGEAPDWRGIWMRNSGRRVARMKATASRRLFLFQYSDSCYWCGVKLDFESSTVDHVIPILGGGTNRVDNTVLCCLTCNQTKGGKIPGEGDWYDWLWGRIESRWGKESITGPNGYRSDDTDNVASH